VSRTTKRGPASATIFLAKSPVRRRHLAPLRPNEALPQTDDARRPDMRRHVAPWAKVWGENLSPLAVFVPLVFLIAIFLIAFRRRSHPSDAPSRPVEGPSPA